MWAINWQKVSEIAFDAVLTGVVSAAIILFTYWLGKRQADNNWKRDIARRDEEKKEQEHKELVNKQIDILRQLIDFKGMLEYRAGYDYLHQGSVFLDGNEKHHIIATAIYASGLFFAVGYFDVLDALNKLMDMTSWDLKVPPTEEKTLEEVLRRTNTVEDIFHVFTDKLLELELKLIPE